MIRKENRPVEIIFHMIPKLMPAQTFYNEIRLCCNKLTLLQHLDRVDEAENDEMEFGDDKEDSEEELESQSDSGHRDDGDDESSSEKSDGDKDDGELEFEDDVGGMESANEKQQTK